LNPPDGLSFVLDDENVSRLYSIDTRPIFLLKAREIERLVPPRIDMWLRKPPLQRRKVGPVESAE
jgi:hypothetical protein